MNLYEDMLNAFNSSDIHAAQFYAMRQVVLKHNEEFSLKFNPEREIENFLALRAKLAA